MSRPASSSYQMSYNLGGKSSGASSDYTSKDSHTAASSSIKVEANDYVPKRYGLKYDPPTIILEYLVPSSGKLYHHKMKMPYLRADSDIPETLEMLRKKHAQYFSGSKISETQVRALVEKLKKKLQASAATTGTFLTGSDFSDKKDFGSGFKIGNMTSINSSLGSKPNGLSSAATTAASKGGFGSSTLTKKDDKKKASDFWDVEGLEDDDEVDYNTANLNKLSKEEVQKHKNKMDVLFNKNNKKPGDEGFEYDKQEEFVPTHENEWDDEDF